LYGKLVVVVSELVMQDAEVVVGALDAHLEADVVARIDVPGARVAVDVAVAGRTNSDRSQKVCGSLLEAERYEELLGRVRAMSCSVILRISMICVSRSSASPP
jgi:hypothetical protein